MSLILINILKKCIILHILNEMSIFQQLTSVFTYFYVKQNKLELSLHEFQIVRTIE